MVVDIATGGINGAGIAATPLAAASRSAPRRTILLKGRRRAPASMPAAFAISSIANSVWCASLYRARSPARLCAPYHLADAVRLAAFARTASGLVN
jgi:hypothetical protein